MHEYRAPTCDEAPVLHSTEVEVRSDKCIEFGERVRDVENLLIFRQYFGHGFSRKCSLMYQVWCCVHAERDDSSRQRGYGRVGDVQKSSIGPCYKVRSHFWRRLKFR